MRKFFAGTVAVGVAAFVAALWAARYVAFGLLLFLRPLVSYVFGGAAALFLVALVVGLLVASDRHNMLWGFLAAGLGSTAILFCYDTVVMALAPGRFPILLTR